MIIVIKYLVKHFKLGVTQYKAHLDRVKYLIIQLQHNHINLKTYKPK